MHIYPENFRKIYKDDSINDIYTNQTFLSRDNI